MFSLNVGGSLSQYLSVQGPKAPEGNRTVREQSENHHPPPP